MIRASEHIKSLAAKPFSGKRASYSGPAAKEFHAVDRISNLALNRVCKMKKLQRTLPSQIL